MNPKDLKLGSLISYSYKKPLNEENGKPLNGLIIKKNAYFVTIIWAKELKVQKYATKHLALILSDTKHWIAEVIAP